MLHKFKCKNSWTLSVENKQVSKYTHYYFCACSQEFELHTNIDDPDAPDILCPMCGNDYFKDVDIFETMTSTKIWKDFKWETVVNEDKDTWCIALKYDLPMYDQERNEVRLDTQDLLHIKVKKDGSAPFKVSYESKIIFKYSLFLDDRVQSFKKILLDEAKENLYKFIISNKCESIEWIDTDNIKELPINKKLKYITFFLKNDHLKEHEFFFWRMENIKNHTIKYTTQVEMLDFIASNHKEKSIKRALYKGYENSINYIGYYPYSDYIFSRTIDNKDLLVKLFEIYPTVKQHIFTDETFFVADEFIEFLKQHYTEKQLVRLFTQEMQDVKNYKEALQNWRDTLRMLQTQSAFQYLDEHFLKVKLTSKKLHDEIVRIFNLVSSELEGKETFDYNEIYLSACNKCEELEFKLPKSVKELSLWAGILHNCMLGYRRSIHEGRSIIYGVFRAEQLLYAVELNNLSIVQAKAVLNRNVPENDMTTIRGWNNKLRTIQT